MNNTKQTLSRAGKFKPSNSLAPIQRRSRGKLPHWDKDEGNFFTTFRLADSLPASVRESILAERDDIVKTAEHLNRELSIDEQRRLEELHTVKIEEWLHAGYGACSLRDDRCAEIVANALKFFHGQRYSLFAWCVMPNHVHAVFKAHPGHRLSSILHSWKSFTAKECNKVLQRSGTFWMDESFDRLIRDAAEFEKYILYVLNNPSKAGLIGWKWVGEMG